MISALWQLIETAPKDEDKDILVLCEDGYITIANWQKLWPRGFYWAEARCVDGLHLREEVTHWMHIPPPPLSCSDKIHHELLQN